MADITSRDFQELIKRQKETTDSLQTIIQQNEKAGTPRERRPAASRRQAPRPPLPRGAPCPAAPHALSCHPSRAGR